MLTIETAPDVTIVALAGRLDGITTPTLQASMTEILAAECNVVIDLSDLSYVASVGLRLLLLAVKRTVQSGRKLALCALQPQVYEVFEVAGLKMLMTICVSRQEALASVRTVG